MKKLISCMLLVTLITTQCLSLDVLAGTSITDIDGHWATKTLQKWVEKDVIHGNGKGEFRPDTPITRAEFFTLLNNVLGYTDSNANNFEDVNSNEWYSIELLKARSAGYLIGYDNNKANPTGYVRRQEAFYLMTEAFKLNCNKDISIEFTDENLINGYAYDAIKTLISIGALLGYSDNTLRPNDYITKVEMISIIDKIVGVYINEAGTYTLPKDNNGIVIINSKDVIIKDSEIKNTLFIAQSVGDGEVTLENTIIDGDVYIKGGGENSIKLKNCKIASIIVDRKNGKVRIVAEGNTSIQKAAVNSNTKLENNSKVGFMDVSIDTQFNDYEVELVGTFDKVLIDSPVKVKLIGDTKVKNITVAPNSKPVIETSKDSSITNLQVDSSLEILGKGKITNSVINAEDVNIEAIVGNVIVSNNVDNAPIINGKEYKEPPRYDYTNDSSDDNGNNNDGNEDNGNNNEDTNDENKDKYLVVENDYLKLYSLLPLVDGKVDPTSELTVATKDGYSIGTGLITIKDIISDEEMVAYFFSPEGGMTGKSVKVDTRNSSKSLKYGTSIEISLLCSIINDVTKENYPKASITFSTKEYTGDSKPLLINEIKDIKLIKNKQDTFWLYNHIYHPFKMNMIYNISVSDTNALNVNYREDGSLSIVSLEQSDKPITVSIIAIDEQGEQLTEEFNVEIIDPVTLKHEKIDNGIDYVQVKLINGYGIKKDNLRYVNYIDHDNNISNNVKVKDLVFANNSDEIVTEFKVYMTDNSEAEIDFDPTQKYIYALRCNKFCDMNGKDIGNCEPSQVSLLIESKGKLIDNEYFTLYTDRPLKDEKATVDSRFIIEFKDGYGVVNRDEEDGYLSFFSLEGGNGASWVQEYEDQPNIVKKITIENHYKLSDSNNLKYNTPYKFYFDYSKLINKNGNSLNLEDKTTYEIPLEEYEGEDKPLAVGNLKNFKMIVGTEINGINFNFGEIIYSPTGKDITFEVVSTNEDVCSVTGSGISFTAEQIGNSKINIKANDGSTIVEYSFDLSVVESPITFEYVKDASIGYIKMTINDGYTFALENIILGFYLFEDGQSIDYEIKPISKGIYNLYAVNSGEKIDFTKNKKYKVNAGMWVVNDQQGTVNDFINEGIIFNLEITNTPVKRIQDFSQINLSEKITLNLEDYFEDIDGDSISYEVTTEKSAEELPEQIAVTKEENEYSFEATSEAESGKVVNVTIKATDGEQAEPTKVDLTFTINENEGKKVLTMSQKTE